MLGSLKVYDDLDSRLDIYGPQVNPTTAPPLHQSIIPVDLAPPPKLLKPPKNIPTPTPTPSPTPSPLPSPSPTVIPIPKTSTFKKAYKKFIKTKKRTKINTQGLIKDFIENNQIPDELKLSLNAYQSQEALTEMKKFDKLGSPERPIPLFLIQHLLSERNFHALFNLNKILGTKIYVIENFKNSRPKLIEIIYNRKKGWTFWFINPD